jgi:GAF domain-containing protein
MRESAAPTGSQRGIIAWLLKRQTIEIFEAILGVAAIGLLDYFLPLQLGLQQFDLYLLWVVVLGIAARYGAPAGYVACILAAIVFEGLIVLHASPYTSISPHEAIQPFLLFVAGILVSELVRSHKHAAEEAQQKLQKANTLFHTLQEQYTRTVDIRNELERRIANQPISTGIVTDFASRMNTLRTQDLYPTILDLLHSMLEVDACALYLPDNRQMRLMIGQPEGYAGRPGMITSNEVLAYRALRERRVVTIRDVVQQQGPGTPPIYGMLAGPLLGRDGQLLGLIVIEAMPFFKVTPGNIRIFEQLLLWIATSLQNALLMETLAQRTK